MTIYIGAHKGLNAKQRQQISFKEGALAPVAASAALFGAYLLLKFFPDLNLQTIFDAYFWLLGSVAVVGGFGPPMRTLVGARACVHCGGVGGWGGCMCAFAVVLYAHVYVCACLLGWGLTSRLSLTCACPPPPAPQPPPPDPHTHHTTPCMPTWPAGAAAEPTQLAGASACLARGGG
jgi:hypothetical protein